ncbi:MAG: hypothetical protein CMH50_01800 [Myxococcales bacterium]|nr:hypothetical protein [Myxococcales bacterium]
MVVKPCQLILFLEEPRFSRPGSGLAGRLTPSRAEAYFDAMSGDLLGLATAWCRRGPGRSVRVNLAPGPETAEIQRTIKRLGFECVVDAERSEIEHLKLYTNEVRTESCPVIFLRPRAPDLPVELLEKMMTSPSHVTFLPTTDGGWHALHACLPQTGLFEEVAFETAKEARDTAERIEERGLSIESVRPWPVVQTLSDLEALWHRLRKDPARAPRCHSLLEAW